MEPMTISPEDLRARREALGMSQAQLGRALDVGADTVWRWETGRRAIGTPGLLARAMAHLEHEVGRQRVDQAAREERARSRAKRVAKLGDQYAAEMAG